MAWSGLACLNFFINSLIWNNNVNNPAPVWCDICGLFAGNIQVSNYDLHVLPASRLHLIFVIAIPMATLCTSRRVYLLIKGNMASTTEEVLTLPLPSTNRPRSAILMLVQKRRTLMLDLFLCLGIPLIKVILSMSHIHGIAGLHLEFDDHSVSSAKPSFCDR